MILEKQTNATIQQEGETQESIGMSLDMESAQVLMQMLSKNLYSDAVGSTIRECASNALDSHRRAGVDKPIVVSFRVNHETNNYEFSVEDFGTGLNDDDVRNIISKYGKSTKRNSANELGMMGLGFKAPLAYCSSFYFTCRKDGMERKYMMYEGEDVNTIDLLYEKPTTEGNGVKVIVPVNYYDRHDFIEKTSEQLAYFENVYFDLDGFDNNFSIIRAEHFQFSPLAKDNRLHICLDNVYYPLEFDKLGINRIDFPVALRFSLTDGIFPTPNRESIRYTKEAKAIILKKIEAVANYFIEKYNESVEDTDDFMNIYDYYASNNRYLKTFKTLDVSIVKSYATIPMKTPNMKGIQLLNLENLCSYQYRDYILNEYKVQFGIESGKFRTYNTSWRSQVSINDVKDRRHTFFIYKEKISGMMKDYLKSIYNGNYNAKKNICRKVKPYTLGSAKQSAKANAYTTYYDILRLGNYPKSEWRQRITEFQTIVNSLTKNWVNIDEIVIPQSFIDSKKKVKVGVTTTSGPKARRIKLQGEIVGKELAQLERDVFGKNSKQVSTTYKLEDMHRRKCLTVYGKHDDYSRMDKIFKVFDKNQVKFVTFSERELKNLENIQLHNLMPIDKFMEGKNKPFKRIVTAHLIDKLNDKYRCAFNKSYMLKDVSSVIMNKIDELEAYKDKHHKHANDDVYESMVEVATEHNLFDTTIYDVYLEIKGLLETFTFIEPLMDKFSGKYYSTDVEPMFVEIITDMFKYHRKRIDWQRYKIGEVNITPIQKEEDIQELVD